MRRLSPTLRLFGGALLLLTLLAPDYSEEAGDETMAQRECPDGGRSAPDGWDAGTSSTL